MTGCHNHITILQAQLYSQGLLCIAYPLKPPTLSVPTVAKVPHGNKWLGVLKTVIQQMNNLLSNYY
jgi:hypothetical protein